MSAMSDDWLVELSCFFFKQKTAYEMRISDWSSDVCSSDLLGLFPARHRAMWSGRHRQALCWSHTRLWAYAAQTPCQSVPVRRKTPGRTVLGLFQADRKRVV